MAYFEKQALNFNKLENFNPYIIAEIGVNHSGSMNLAKKLIELAKEGGAHAAKFQSYKAEKIASKNSPSYWDTSKEKTQSQYKLFKKYDTFNESDYKTLAEYCRKCNIDFLSTPFDDEAIDFLDPLVPFFKIASADITNLPFLEKVASKGKKIILSTGASNLDEIDLAIKTIKNTKEVDIALLHCILNYPTENVNANLNMITGLIERYPDYLIGYSDHTIPDKGMTTLTTANLLGARIIEKHFTHDKTLKGNDHYHAMDVEDLKNFTKIIGEISVLRGITKIKKAIESEKISRINARRSIVTKTKLPKNHVLVANDLTYKRPGTGISPQEWYKVIGMKTTCSLEADHILQWSNIN